jgi:hypothetical protein
LGRNTSKIPLKLHFSTNSEIELRTTIMKRIIILLILAMFFMPKGIKAQYTLNFNISYPAPIYLSDWHKSQTGIATVVFNIKEEVSVQAKFKTQLQNVSGDILASSNDASAVVYTIRKGANTFSLDKILQLENLQFSVSTLIRNIQTVGKLPEGNYQLCIQLISVKDNSVLLKVPVCRSFTQANYQLPYLLAPNDKTWLDANIAQSVITFRWSNIVPRVPEFAIFRLQVFEIKDYQQPMQALRSNQPILNVELRNTTQYFWRPQLSFKDSVDHIFIWTIQTLDSRRNPITSVDENNQGRSEPRVFGVSLRKKSDEGNLSGRNF